MGVKLSDQFSNVIKINGENIVLNGLEVICEYISFSISVNLVTREEGQFVSLRPTLNGGHRIEPVKCKTRPALHKVCGMRYIYIEELPFARDVLTEQQMKEYQKYPEEKAEQWLKKQISRSIVNSFNVVIEISHQDSKILLDIKFICLDTGRIRFLFTYFFKDKNKQLNKLLLPV